MVKYFQSANWLNKHVGQAYLYIKNDMIVLKVLQISDHADEGPRSLCLCTVVHLPHQNKDILPYPPKSRRSDSWGFVIV